MVRQTLSRLHLPPVFHQQPYTNIFRITLILSILYYVLVIGSAIAIYKYDAQNRIIKQVERIFPYPAAIVDGEIIPLTRYRKEVSALQFVRTKKSLKSSDTEIKESVMTRLTDNILYQGALARTERAVTEAQTDAFLSDQAQKIGGKENLVKFVQEEYGNQLTYEDFRLVTKELLVRSVIEKEILSHAHINHILIAVPENASEGDVSAAKKRITDIKSKITTPNMFGEVAKHYSEDIVSREKNGDLGTTSRGPLAKDYSQAFEDILFNIPLNTVSEPIRSKVGWHLILVDKREGIINDNLDHYTQQLRDTAAIKVFVKM